MNCKSDDVFFIALLSAVQFPKPRRLPGPPNCERAFRDRQVRYLLKHVRTLDWGARRTGQGTEITLMSETQLRNLNLNLIGRQFIRFPNEGRRFYWHSAWIVTNASSLYYCRFQSRVNDPTEGSLHRFGACTRALEHFLNHFDKAIKGFSNGLLGGGLFMGL